MAVKSIDTIKSYLTEGKYPTASELVDIIDTLVSIGQNSGGSASGSHLELVPDLDAYTDAPVGEIVKYNGQTNNKYTRGWDYEKVSNTQQGRGVTSIVYTDDVSEALKQAVDSLVFPLLYDNEQVPVYYFSLGSTLSSPQFASVGTKTPAVGDPIFACDGSGVYHVTNAYTANSRYNIYIDHPTYTSNYVLDFNKTFFKWHDSNGDTVLLRHMENASGSGYHLTTEDVFIEKDNVMYFGSDNGKTQAAYDDLQIPLWQLILMPTENNVQTDVELSSSSHYPVENATLYDELRVEEAGSVLSVNGTNYPIVELDATDFDLIVYTGASDTDFTFKVIPTLDSNKAYIIKNANFTESVNDYSFSNQGTFIVKFQPSGNIGQYTSISIGHNNPDGYNYYQTEGTEYNEWLSIPATYQFNVTNSGGYDNDTTKPYYGTPYEDGGNSTITELTNAAETTGSASVIKSLKAKVMELEAQIAQISTQLQNIASN